MISLSTKNEKKISQPHKETKNTVLALSKLLREKQEELDVLVTKQTLHEMFWKINRSKADKFFDILASAGIASLLSIFIFMAPMISELVTYQSVLTSVLAPFIVSAVITSGYMIKRNRNYTKAFHNLNKKLGKNALSNNKKTVYEEEKGLYPYILLINAYEIVTKGDFKDTKNSYPDDDIELEECLHIMNKCLNEEALAEDVISLAEKNGLIKNTDKMMTKSEKTINYEDFCTLLYRMLNHHMGHYFKFYDDEWTYSFYRKEKTDEKGYRYRDYLDYVKNQDVKGFYVSDIYK